MLTLSRAVMLPSHYANRVGTPKEVFEALYPAHQCLCLRFAPCLAANCARLEVRMVRYSFPVRLFHSLLHAGLSRRSSVPDFRSLPVNLCDVTLASCVSGVTATLSTATRFRRFR
jgi:hypothetical protein